MVRDQLAARGIHDQRVLDLFRTVPRHAFVSRQDLERAYADMPLSIGPRETISQPYIVALMLEKLALSGKERVLEIGTGSGYETVLLSHLAAHVYSVEISAELVKLAEPRIKQYGKDNVDVMVGDGYRGWKEHAPYDRIIVSAAPVDIPRELVRQLKPDGLMLLPFGEEDQELILLRHGPEGLQHEELGAVRFVPMRKKKEE
jgi:protein-L-isoaspartate(D-aspartate) O-methyltransferase